RDRDGSREAPPREDRGRPLSPPTPRNGLGCRLQVRAVIELAILVTLATLVVGLIVAFGLSLLPTLRMQLVGLAFLAVVLPLGAVLLSGWVMFHMGDDVKILAVAAASASAAVIAALLLTRKIAAGIDRLRLSSSALAGGDLSARA